MNYKKRITDGFTIVELLVVIVVIGILASITIVSYTGISNRASDSSVLADLASMDKVQKLHLVDDPNAVTYNSVVDGLNNSLGYKFSSDNVIDVATSGTDYCIRGYNPKGIKNSISNAYIKESSAGACSTIAPSTVAVLSSMTVAHIGTGISLTPTFSQFIPNYEIMTGYDNDTISVTPTRGDPNATILVNGTAVTSGQASSNISLINPGQVYPINVTLNSGTFSRNYSINASRASSPYLTTLLLKRGPSTITPTPSFAVGTLNYNASMLAGNLSVTPTSEGGSIKVNGTSVASGSALSIPYTAGSYIVTIVCNSVIGTDQKIYIINLTVN